MLCIIGFSVNSIACIRKESNSKWGKYKLTIPVKRKTIIQSYFVSQMIWTLFGIVLTAICMSAVTLIHGFVFDISTDILSIFVAGFSISLFSGAVFFPLFYIGGEERNEAILGISLVIGVGIFMALIFLINNAFEYKMSTPQVFFCMAIISTIAIIMFLISYLVTVKIFNKKEY